MTDHTPAAQAATREAVRHAIRKAYDDGYNDAKMAPDNCSTYCVERAVRLDSAALLSKLRAPVADERKEIAGVTLDGCLETLFRVGEHLGIDYAESRKQPGAPSGIYIKAIEDRVSQAMNAAREEAARLMEQTSRSSGATLIRSLASAPVAGEADLPKAYIVRHGTTEALFRSLKRANAAAEDVGPGSVIVPLYAYAAPQASEAVLKAIQFVLKNFKASEAQGYHTRDRQFAISILEQALSAQPGAQKERSDGNQ
ncbi:hypothetical protein [Achromobacter insolitus]|uniref:hypothetical protein n=1 Tax=Achromobacter insolitus TaxID=217204 RepID=UPI0020A4C2C1|nr:hypothetical protein [Achromobacter insolitus]MCP1404297.1 hypothetical protein [Achromobacter insolitus]